MYKYLFKPLADRILAALALLLLLLPMLLIAIAIKLDSRGPVFFKQKRIGLHKKHFYILKFRSMRTDTPHDAPTHLLKGATSYITRVGAFLRKTSLDELPQLFNILCGRMSFIGPRPALWNQNDLIAERDKYGANAIRPGLTGLAQICGRDALEIPQKAALDGEYTAALNTGRCHGFAMDIRCFFGTFASVLRSDGVVEGGTGEPEKQKESDFVKR